MKRDMYKTAAKVKLKDAYCMTADEMIDLLKLTKSGDSNLCFNAIDTAFRYGYELGQRALKREALG